MRRGVLGLVLLPLLASLAWAEPPRHSLRPMPSPHAHATAPADRPQARPTAQPAARTQTETATPVASRKGSVCNNPNIKGVALKPIKSRTKGCNVKAPVSVTSINGVRLDPAATLNCEAAEALSSWIDRGLQPAFNNQVVQLNIAGSYSCRSRNNVRGARISEHGTGGAIDIAGFVLRSGKTMTVARNYGSEIKRAKKAACGTFHTTLGPGSDGYHEDHIHLDVAHRRGSAYCH